jgi:hypothetical protein
VGGDSIPTYKINYYSPADNGGLELGWIIFDSYSRFGAKQEFKKFFWNADYRLRIKNIETL